MAKFTATQIKKYPVATSRTMVMPLVDEYKPKCYLCNNVFDTIEKLREHQETDHGDYINFHKKQNREPAPGDVTIF
ncbi:MAG: hypothetical protein ACK4TO_04520 [Candidatus Nitrosotenuis sp.]